MKKVIVIGGGLSGLSTSVFLAEKGISTLLIEASPKLGGRTYSFNYSNQNEIIDNGQHILMGCYLNTFKYLKIIKSLDKLEFQENLTVNFVDKFGILHKLKSDKFFYPLNLLSGILNYKAVSIRERISILKSFLTILFIDSSKIKNKSTLDLLTKLNQSDNSIKSFWEIIHVGTLNTELKYSSAETFVRILKTIFFTGNESTKIVIPKFGLSQVFIDNAVKFLNEKDCEISLSERLIDLEIKNEKVVKLLTNKREIVDFDFVVSAIPFYAIRKFGFIKEHSSFKYEMEYSTILSVNLWLKVNPFEEKFYGLIDSDIHWIFNHKNYISIVTSSANRFNEKDDKEIVDKFIKEIELRFINFKKEFVSDYKVIKEKRATYIPSKEIEQKRMNLNRKFGNLILSGDWTNTKLPSTIESAITSGILAANEIINEKIY